MGKVSGDKERKFEKSRNVMQLLYYVLAVLGIFIYIYLTLILPNIDFPAGQITNSTIPLPP